MSTRSQIACAWSGLGLIIVVVGGFLLLAGYLPPPIQANDSPFYVTAPDDPGAHCGAGETNNIRLVGR